MDGPERLHNNLIEYLRTIGRAGGACVADNGRVVAFHSGMPFPSMNTAIPLSLHERIDGPDIEWVEEWYAHHEADYCWWVRGDEAVMDNRGWRKQAIIPGMMADSGLAESIDLPNIKVIDHPPERDFVSVTISGYGFPNAHHDNIAKLSRTILSSDRFDVCMIELDGIPSSVGTLFKGTDCAGIYWVCTQPSARRRGLGRVLTDHLLGKARESDYDIVTLQSSPAGHGLYLRTGFKDIVHYDMMMRSTGPMARVALPRDDL